MRKGSKGRMSMRKTLLALLLAASVTPALAQDKTVNLKVSLWVPPAHPLVPATQAWAADIEKASGGTIKVDGVSLRATRQGVRPLRHGARRHRRHHLCQPRLSARPFPDRRRRTASLRVLRRQEGHAGAERVVQEIRADRDEGHQALLRLHPRSRRAARQEEDRGARPISRASRCARRKARSAKW